MQPINEMRAGRSGEEVLLLLMDNSAADVIKNGSGNWVLRLSRARKARYVVCCRKKSARPEKQGQSAGSAFLIGVISRFVEVPNPNLKRGQQYFRIMISQHAIVDEPNVWVGKSRNPVAYALLSDLPFDVTALELNTPPLAPRQVGRLSIAEAKAGLAENFGVSIEDVEIIIRG